MLDYQSVRDSVMGVAIQKTESKRRTPMDISQVGGGCSGLDCQVCGGEGWCTVESTNWCVCGTQLRALTTGMESRWQSLWSDIRAGVFAPLRGYLQCSRGLLDHRRIPKRYRLRHCTIHWPRTYLVFHAHLPQDPRSIRHPHRFV